VFTQSDGKWRQQQKFTPKDGHEEDRFGSLVSVTSDGTTALIGALSRIDAAYIFTQNDGEWSQKQKLDPPDDDEGEFRVVTMSRDAETILIGAIKTVPEGGSAHVFVGK